MKGRTSIASLVLLVASALAVYAFAQADKRQEEKQSIVKKTMLIDKQVITLLKVEAPPDDPFSAAIRENGKVAYVQIPSTPTNRPTTFRNATLRIAMQDGSVQEIPLIKVKEVVIEQGGNIR